MNGPDQAEKKSHRNEATSASGDLSSAVTLYRAGRLRPFDLYKRLTGPRQMWWDYCQGAARSSISRLGQQDLDEALAIIRAKEPPQSGGAVTDGAQAVYQVSSALVLNGDGETGNGAVPPSIPGGDRELRNLLIEAARRWRNGPAAPGPEVDTPFPVAAAVARVPYRLQDRTRAVLSLLGDPNHDRGQAMVAICALMLAGVLPSTRRAVQVRVVLAVRQEGQVDGVTGRLEVREFPGGPAGLYPDPKALVVQRTDTAFDRALRLAWEFAGGKKEHRCVLWRVALDADVPAYGIDGSSLGTAFAIALQELLHRRPASRMLAFATLRGFLIRLRPSCAITGELSNQRPADYSRQTTDRGPWLTSVGQMDAKLKAVSAKHLRLVAPAANKPASGSDIPADLHVYWAKTLRQADRYVRRIRPIRTVGIGLALVALIGGSVGPALAVHYNGTAQQQHVAAISAQLTSTANGLRTTDPALAAQLDVAAYQAAPNANAFTAMLNDEDTPLDTIVPSQAEAFALSPAGDVLAAVPLTGPVTLQDVADPTRPAVPLGGSGPQGDTGAFPIGFSPDGRILAAPVPAGGIRLWNVADPAHPAALSLDFGVSVTSLAFSPGGSIVAAGTQQGTIQLWNISNLARPVPLGSPVSAAGSSGRAVTALMFSSNGQSLYSGSLSGLVDVWNTSTSGSLRLASQPVPGVQGQQDQITFSQHGQAVVTDGSGNTFLYNLTGQSSPQAITGSPAAISPNGLTIATRDQAGNITLLNTTQPLNYPLGPQLPVVTPTAEGATSPGPMTFDADGNVLAAGDSGTGIMLWHLPVGYQPDSVLPLSPLLEPDSIDGSTAAIANGNSVFVQDLSSGMQVTYHINGSSSGLAEAVPALGADGRLLAFGDKDGSVSLWSLRNPGDPVSLDRSFATGVTNLTLSANGRVLAATTRDGSVGLWNLANPARPTPFGGPVGSDAVLAALSPDGQTLAVLDNTDSVHLWSLSDPSHPATTGSGVPLGGGRSGAIAATALALSPGGKMLAVATTAGTVRLWNLGSTPATYGELLTSNFDSFYNFLVTRVDSVGVNSLAFSPDGQTLSAINADSTIRIWDLQPATVIGNICADTAQALTPAVWNRYLPGDPYQPPCRADATAGQEQATAAPTTTTEMPGSQTQTGLCTSSELTLSSHAGATQDTLVLVVTNKSRNSCSLYGIPAVSLAGPADPPLGGVYQVESTALPGQAPVPLPVNGQAHINLTYLAASPADIPSGGGNPMWVPKTVKMTLPGTDGTLTIPWLPRVAILRQDMASVRGTFTGPFLPGNGLATSATPGPVATVDAYVAAVNRHDYTLAWKLGGDNIGTSYHNFVASIASTEKDTLHILDVQGSVVTANLTEVTPNGTSTVETIFRVTNGVITSFYFQ